VTAPSGRVTCHLWTAAAAPAAAARFEDPADRAGIITGKMIHGAPAAVTNGQPNPVTILLLKPYSARQHIIKSATQAL